MPKSKQEIPGRVRSAYAFIKTQRNQYSVQMMCRVLEGAVSGYYDWLHDLVRLHSLGIPRLGQPECGHDIAQPSFGLLQVIDHAHRHDHRGAWKRRQRRDTRVRHRGMESLQVVGGFCNHQQSPISIAPGKLNIARGGSRIRICYKCTCLCSRRNTQNDGIVKYYLASCS